MENNTIKDILNKNWRYSYTRRMSYQKIRLYHYAYWNGFAKIFNFRQRFELYRFINGDQSNYFVAEEVDGFERSLSEKFLNKKFIIKTIKILPSKIKRDFKDYLSFAKSLPQDLNGYSNAKIKKTLRKYYKQEQKVGTCFWILFETVEKILISSLKKRLGREGLSDKETEGLLKKLSEPIKIIPLDMERLSLLRISLLDDKKQDKVLERHCGEFCYMPMYDIGFEPYDLNYFKDRLEELKKRSKEDIGREVREIEEKYKNRYNYHLKTLKNFKSKKEVYCLLRFFSNFGYLKDFKPYTRDKGSYYVKNLFREVAKRLKLTLDQTLFLNERELEEMLDNKISIKPGDLEKRKNDSIYYCDKENIYLITDKAELNEIDGSLNKKEEVRELKGLGVSQGIAKGAVSIILSNNDFNKFKEGEILVTSATRPDFVPLMKKARAVVTDEGGMLSHAAIISRELRKPCIVGTLKSTKALKDGDWVEVDADKGIVRILK